MKTHLLTPGRRIDLSQLDASGTGRFKGGKKAAGPEIAALTERLARLQELLYAQAEHRVLVVLQAMDTGGKDGVIRRVFSAVNPQGVRVSSFKVPTAVELSRDFLWRVHQVVPGNGEMVIFNRSHYEDVLVVRVRNLAPPDVWSKRYAQINDFERLLAESGKTILKFFLHIDLDEQKKRLQARLDDPAKHWKFRLGDLDDRKFWPEYMRAYEDVLEKTSTEYAPWYIIPANRKWYRDLAIAGILVETLEGLKMEFPKSGENLDGVVIE